MQLLKKILHTLTYKKTRDPLIKVHINKAALCFNYEYFKSLGKDVIPVLKGNAYGHGLKEVSEIIDAYRPLYIAVDALDEAIRMRRDGIVSPILILGYCSMENAVFAKLTNCTYVISSLTQLSQWIQIPVQTHVHLEMNTGMNRHGIDIHDIPKAQKLIENSKLIVSGICSHFADADTQDSQITRNQIREWNEVREISKKLFPTASVFHLSNTEGALLNLNTTATRIGGGLYGLDLTTAHSFGITKPVMSIKAILTDIRTVPKGAGVGYNHTFIAPAYMKIASIPMGYNEGIDRRLSNKGMVYVGGKRCPIVGRVSMNITLIDVSNVPDVQPGDIVEIISPIRKQENSLDALALVCNTISYELAVHISPLLRRIVS